MEFYGIIWVSMGFYEVLGGIPRDLEKYINFFNDVYKWGNGKSQGTTDH